MLRYAGHSGLVVTHLSCIEMCLWKLDIEQWLYYRLTALSSWYVFQINKDPDVRLDPFFVVGDEIPKKVWLLTCSLLHHNFIFTGSIACSTKRRYLSYWEGDFEFFCPIGWYVVPMEVKFSRKVHSNFIFHPNRCNDNGIWPQKLKILVKIFPNFGI